jgi:hypothetical protein
LPLLSCGSVNIFPASKSILLGWGVILSDRPLWSNHTEQLVPLSMFSCKYPLAEPIAA